MDNLDIWVQQSAGTPLRVTDDPADEGEPAFSPDGSRLAYRSERDGGGIYLTATLGGQEPRLFVADGRRPRFSPDGRSITYWTGTDIGFAESVGSYRTFVVRADGGSAQEISGFTGARYPVWAPDGRSLLVLGSRDERPAAASYDWWRVPLDGSAPVRVGMVDTMRRAGVIFEGEDVGTIGPDAWENNRVLFSDGSHLWSLQLDPRSGTAVSAQRLTFGTGRDLHPATGKMDRLAFTSAMVTNAVWALPIDADRGVVTGAPQPVTGFTGYAARPSATVRGDLVAYRSLLPRPSILIKNLRTKGIFDIGVAGSAFGPALAPDGTSVAYEADGGVSVVSVRGGSARVLCRPCVIGAWSADGRRLVIVGSETNAGRLTSIDASTGASQDLIVRPQTAVNRPFVSPDGRLLVFRVTVAQRDAIMIAPIATQVPAAKESWIEMVAPETDARPAGWSPDGGIVYFVSGRDGTRCLYAQRVNRTTGALVGAPFDVRHFHRARNVLRDSSGFVLSTGPATAVTNGFFFYDLGGFSSNIWTIETR
jgi:Tol biopolymer transport system component